MCTFHPTQASFMRRPFFPANFGGLNGPKTFNNKPYQAAHYDVFSKFRLSIVLYFCRSVPYYTFIKFILMFATN